MDKVKKENIIPSLKIESLIKTFYFSETYYNSLDFIYKYTREVLIYELTEVDKDFFKKIFTNLEDHRFAREKAISSNSLYNNIYPTLGISINQDFSGPGNRTRMNMSHRLNIINSEETIPVIFRDKNISIQLGSNIYKYNLSLNVRFQSAYTASNFISRIYNTIHVNKYYYPEYFILKYKIDLELYKLLRVLYRDECATEEDFLEYLNRHTNFKFIREFDKASGNINYFLLLNIRPLAMIQSPSQMDSNVNGLRESNVILNIDLEIELPNTLYINAPSFLLRDISLHLYNNITLLDKNDPILIKEEIEKRGDEKVDLIREKEPILISMPKVNNKKIEQTYKKELKYTGTVSISTLTDNFNIEDALIIKYLNEKDKEFILKIFDENAKEIIPREVKIFENGIDVILDMYVEETILVLNIYG